MPRFNRQTFSKIPFTSSDRLPKNSRKNETISPSEGISANIRSDVPTSLDPKKSKPPSGPHKVISRGFEKMKTANPKSPRLCLGSQRTCGGKLPSFRLSPESKNSVRSHMAGRELMQEEQESSRLLSVSVSREKLARSRAIEISRRGLLWHSKETSRLSFAKRLQLFRALSKEPLSFLDLHVRFGVSKHAIRRLVKNGLLVEVWGANDVGVQFKLAKDAKNHLKEMEAAAAYDPKIAKKSLIRLKNRI